jgi:hypothetical protein
LNGTSGDDVFELHGGTDTINGNGGTDTVDLEFSPNPVTVNLVTGTMSGWGTATLNGITQIFGGFNGGTLTGGANTTYIAAPGGDTTINGGPLSTTIVLGSGNDTVHAGAGNDVIFAGSGNNIIDGGGGYNAVSYAGTVGFTVVDLYAGAWHNGTYDQLANIVNMVAGNSGSILRGDFQDNIIVGGAGADYIDGREGNDTLTGNGGADTFVFRPGVGNAVVTDFSHVQGDTIDLSSFGTFSTLQGVLAVSSQVGANTVIHVSGGMITLDNVAMASLQASDFSFVGSGGPGVGLPGVAGTASDLDGDGKGDLFWQNRANGSTSAWELNDTKAHGVNLPNAAGWQVMDTGNFNGDGFSGDVLLRNTTTGLVDIWTDNAGQMSGADVDKATLDWNIMGTADFNADGKSDILWRNEQNGYVSVWQMNGNHVATTYNPGQVGLEWHIVGAADFVGDGRAEILWRNANSGEIDLWTIDGPGAGQTHGVKIANLGLEWQVGGSGDFNGDGKSDILWQNKATGQVVIWEMNGSQVLQSQPIATLPSQWKVGSVVDANGDGKADIVWRDSNTGQAVLWAMNGFTIDHQGPLGAVDNNWQTINHHFDWV